MKAPVSGVLLIAVLMTGRAMADPVWDPTEIARLSQQASQLAATLSTTLDMVRSFDKLAAQIGGVGARPSFTATAPSSLAGYSALPATGTPAAADALAMVSGGALTASQRQQNRRNWGAAYQRVAAEGFAVSQVANRCSGNAVSRSQSLAAAAVGSQDLRGDLQANSAVGLAVLSELGAVQAVLALLLEQQSLARLTFIANNGAGS